MYYNSLGYVGTLQFKQTHSASLKGTWGLSIRKMKWWCYIYLLHTGYKTVGTLMHWPVPVFGCVVMCQRPLWGWKLCGRPDQPQSESGSSDKALHTSTLQGRDHVITTHIATMYFHLSLCCVVRFTENTKRGIAILQYYRYTWFL